MSDMDFEGQLKKAMQRVDAPENLAKFIALAAEVQEDKHLPRRDRRNRWAFVLPWSASWVGGAVVAVAAVLVVIFSAGGLHVRQEHERVRTAEKEFEVSQQITEQALEHTREQLQRAGVPVVRD